MFVESRFNKDTPKIWLLESITDFPLTLNDSSNLGSSPSVSLSLNTTSGKRRRRKNRLKEKDDRAVESGISKSGS